MMRLRLSRRRFVALASLVAPLSGCSLLLPSQSSPQLYRLTPRTDSTPRGPVLHSQLVVAVPAAPESLDTDRIALTRSQTELDYFASSVWTDRAPVLVQGLLVDAFQNSGRILAVGGETNDISANYLLNMELRDFQARYSGAGDSPPAAVVTISVQLVRVSNRKVVASMVAANQAQAAQNNLNSIVEAFDTAVGEVVGEIVGWTLRTVERGR